LKKTLKDTMKKPAAGKGCLTDDYGDENVAKIRYEYEVYRDRQKRMQSNFVSFTKYMADEIV